MSEDYYEPEPWEENHGRKARVLPTDDQQNARGGKHQSLNPEDWQAMGFIVEEVF